MRDDPTNCPVSSCCSDLPSCYAENWKVGKVVSAKERSKEKKILKMKEINTESTNPIRKMLREDDDEENTFNALPNFPILSNSFWNDNHQQCNFLVHCT